MPEQSENAIGLGGVIGQGETMKPGRSAIMKTGLGEKARAATTIYILSDPRDGRVRYVGKTERALGVRLSQHIYASKRKSNRTANWIKSLLALALTPSIEAIEVVEKGGDWVEAEQRWIRHYREHGAALTNLGDGGEGNPGYSHRPDTRLRLSKATAAYMNQPTVKREHAFTRSKFKPEDIESILLRASEGEDQTSIANDYRTKQNYISRIVTGKTFDFLDEYNSLREAAKKATFSNTHVLNAQQVCQIVEDYIEADGRKSYEAVAMDYGVKYSTVHEIISGQIWHDVVPKKRLLMAQSVARNRARQKPSPRRKLTYQQAEEIRVKAQRGSTIRALAREYAVDRQTIKKIVTGRAYREPV